MATAASPAAAKRARTAAPWAAPCSTTSQPPGSRWEGAAAHDGFDRVEPVGATHQRGAGFVRERSERRVAGGDVGWIRSDDVEAAAGQRIEPRAFEEAQVPQPEPGGVALRDGKRRGTHVRRRHRGVRALMGDSERDRAAARAEIEDGRASAVAECGEHALDGELRFRPRHQHVRRHLEVERPELAPPGEVGDGLPGEPAPGERLERQQFFGAQRPVGVCGERGAAGAGDVRDQDLRVERRGRRRGAEPLPERREHAGDARHSSAASSSARCSRASASITSSRLPSTMSSSLYSVSSMRWSVSRPCGKL